MRKFVVCVSPKLIARSKYTLNPWPVREGSGVYWISKTPANYRAFCKRIEAM